MDGVVPAGEGVLRSRGGGGVWPRVRARLDLCVGGEDGPYSGGQRRWIQWVRQSIANPRW